jgi:hypothetical protein
MRRRLAAGLGALVAATTLLAAPAAGAAPRSMHLGFVESSIAFDPDPAARAAWLDRLAGINANRIRVDLHWRSVASRAPQAGENPADPAWPGYRWARSDAAVAEATARGLAPIILINASPDWAAGPRRPADAPPGSWRPDPSAFAAFARAAALRYPSVRFWQAWNEPNLDVYLSPQWDGGKPAAPAHYRRMLNAFHDAVKGVNRSNVVITAGTAPFGDQGVGGNRLPPARFVRELLCLRGQSLRRAPCPNPARFDALSHHPYSTRGPLAPAFNADDVSVSDLHKLVRVLRSAERTGRAFPRKRHRLWVTELSWDSSPPDPQGVPAARHARWLSESLYVLWRDGVDTLTWYLARDQAPVPSFAATYQSGVFLRDGTPKPAARAFAFPLVGDYLARGRARLWSRAPAAGTVAVQRRAGARWVTIARFQAAAAGRILTRTVRLKRGTKIRARAASGLTSLTGTVR